MENQTNCMNHLKNVFAQTREFAVECDLILPDYFPEISKILYCSIGLSEEAVTVTGDKISIAGRADLCLLYASDAAELKVYNSICKYTRVFSGGDFEQGSICLARQNVVSLNYRAVSPRRIEVRASTAVTVKALVLEETVLPAETENADIQKRIAERTGFSISAMQCLRFDLEEKISLPVAREKIGGILRSSVRIFWNEVRAAEHKVMLTGTAEIIFVYITKDNTLSQECSVSLPVTTVREAYGVSEGDACFLNTQNTGIAIDLKNPAAGENEASVNIRIDAQLIAGRERTYSCIEDVFTVRGELKTKKQTVFTPEKILQKNDLIDVAGEIPLYETNFTQICDADAADIAFAVAPEADSLRLNGSFNMKMLARAADGSYGLFSRSCSFEYVFSACASDHYAVQIVPQNFRTELTSDGKVRYYGKLQINALFLQGNKEEIIKRRIDVGDRKRKQNRA